MADKKLSLSPFKCKNRFKICQLCGLFSQKISPKVITLSMMRKSGLRTFSVDNIWVFLAIINLLITKESIKYFWSNTVVIIADFYSGQFSKNNRNKLIEMPICFCCTTKAIFFWVAGSKKWINSVISCLLFLIWKMKTFSNCIPFQIKKNKLYDSLSPFEANSEISEL